MVGARLRDVADADEEGIEAGAGVSAGGIDWMIWVVGRPAGSMVMNSIIVFPELQAGRPQDQHARRF